MALLFLTSLQCTVTCYIRRELISHLKILKGISPPHQLSPPAEERERDHRKEAHWLQACWGHSEKSDGRKKMTGRTVPEYTYLRTWVTILSPPGNTLQVNREARSPQCWMERCMSRSRGRGLRRQAGGPLENHLPQMEAQP